MKKRLLALVLVGVMAFGSSLSVFAAPGDPVTDPADAHDEETGEGRVEDVVGSDVFSVVLPVTDADTFKFIMDPQDLIQTTDAAAYAGLAKGDFTGGKLLYFENHSAVGGAATGYSNESDSVKAINQGSVDVDVTVEAKLTDLGDIAFADDTTVADATVPSLYIGLVDADGTTPLTDESQSILSKVDGTPGNFEIVYDSGAYKYQEVGSPGAYNEYEFHLEGQINALDKADWAAVKTATPKVKLVWTIAVHEDVDLTATVSASSSGDGTKWWYAPAAAVTSITSVVVYNTETGDKLGTLSSSDSMISASGNVQVLKSAVESVKGGATKLSVVVTTDAGTDVFAIE